MYYKKDIEAWLAHNNFSVKIAQDDEYSYDLYENTIYIGGQTSVEITANLFKQFLMNHGCEKVMEFNIHTLAFLHELGHYITVPSFKDEELRLFATIKDMIADLYNNDENTANLKYWSIQDELAANNWAIDFIKTNYQEAKALDNLMTLAN